MAPTVLFLMLIAGMTLEASSEAFPDLEWGEWSQCSQSCGGGRQVRRRVCDAGIDPIACRFLKSRYGWADLVQRRPCNEVHCAVRGTWGTWEEWQPCSSTCGPNSFRIRHRYCTETEQDEAGVVEYCEGGTPDDWIQPCENLPPCPEQEQEIIDISASASESYSSLFSAGDYEELPAESSSSSW